MSANLGAAGTVKPTRAPRSSQSREVLALSPVIEDSPLL